MRPAKKRFGIRRRCFLTAATLATGTLASSCEMTWHDSIIGATKNTFLVATEEIIGSFLDAAASNLGIPPDTKTDAPA